VAVVLSGTLKDGAAGVCKVKRAGGITIAEEPEHAEFKSMPQAAIATGCIDFIVPLEKIGATVQKLCRPQRK
jgi:two-component system chemotaxis response regulator CheB